MRKLHKILIATNSLTLSIKTKLGTDLEKNKKKSLNSKNYKFFFKYNCALYFPQPFY